MSPKVRDWTLLLACNLIWASQFVLVKLVEAELGPVFTTAFPMLMATLLLIPFVHREGRVRRRAGAVSTRAQGAWKRDLRDFLIIGVLGQVAAQLFVTWGTQKSLASNGSLLTLTLPVATAVMAYALLRERMTGMRWLSFGLAIAGVLVASARDLRGLDLAGHSYLVGNVLIFFGVLGSAFYNVFSKKLLDRFSPLQVLLYSYYAVCLFLIPITFVVEPEAFAKLPSLSGRAWLGLGLLAVFQYCLSMVIFLTVLTRLDATQAALSNYMIPVFGVVLSWLVLGERLTPLMLAGGGLVLVSTLLVTVYEEKLAARARAQALYGPPPAT